MKREVFEPFVADVVREQLDALVPHPASDSLAPFVTDVVTEAMRGKSDEKITGKGTLSTAGVAKTVIQAAHRTYLQGRDLTPETVFTMDNIEAVAPKRGKDAGAKRLSLVRAAEMFLGESLGPKAREVEKTYDKPYLPKDFPKIKHWAVSRTTQFQREHAEGVLALCLGAGCTGAAASYLRAEDVTRDDNGTVWVKRYDMVHAVPVSAVFSDVVEELAARKALHEYVLGRGEKPVWHQGLNVGRDFHVLPSRLRATWAVAVCAAVRREVAVSAIGVANVAFFERHLRTNYDRTDPLSDHVEELTDPFTDWPELRAGQRWQPTPSPSAPVAKKTGSGDKAKRMNATDVPVQQQEQYPRSGVTDELARKQRSMFEVIDGGKK
ncbi:hypothetical protein GC584_05855 [Corynebacterium sp. zg912]|uniref:Integrase n=1 Tax=Corynebacterium wankanglinii TaxID=2735136 RepID=A0A7H0K7U2_9CORY|nr:MULTISPECIES: hypothetical protein [Corynebacterium]MBA1837599.1 hypothetical protein [Corynebacterium wankanglinii]MCR5928945.1 hypothetical protein [Corynebacterium sp. zg912]QNP93358.1 hypothetical protein IA203_05325 [Corynebacterium wankanglinii]